MRKSHQINAHAHLSSGATGLKFGLSLPLLPYFVCARSEGSDESAHMRRLVSAFAGRRWDKYQHFLCWHICWYLKYLFLRANHQDVSHSWTYCSQDSQKGTVVRFENRYTWLGVIISNIAINSACIIHSCSHSPPFRWTIHEGLLSVTSESMCTITGG